MEHDERTRCPWGETSDEAMRTYHDEEWGRPCQDETHLFEMLSLELMQAGLSWSCVLHKREAFRAAFSGFDVRAVAAMGPQVDELLQLGSSFSMVFGFCLTLYYTIKIQKVQ